jgi:hypothetical protein
VNSSVPLWRYGSLYHGRRRHPGLQPEQFAFDLSEMALDETTD